MSQSVFPASFAQQRLWFLDQLDPGTAAYNLPRAFRILGPLDVDNLTRAFQIVIERHAALRTVFDSVEGEGRQIVLSEVEAEIPIVDLGKFPQSERETEALRMAAEEGTKPFDLREGPLIRPVLVRLEPERHFLVLTMHHIIADGWSIALLFREVTKTYAALTKGEAPDLPALPLQYTEYAQWQREYMSGQVLAGEIEFWKGKLAGAQPLLELPIDRPRPATTSWHGATEQLDVSVATLTKLKALAQAQSSTLFMVAMAAFQSLLWRYTNQESILIGTPIAGRNDVQLENMIGLFVNTLIFRGDISPQQTFRDVVRQVRSFALDAYAHQDLPFEKLVEELVPQRSLDTHPLFQVLFTFQNIPQQVFDIPGLTVHEMPFEAGIAKFDLSVVLWEAGELHCQFEYNTDLFEPDTIKRLLQHFERILTGVVENPDLAVAKIPLMSTEEREQALVEWNRTAIDYPRDLTIPSGFERQVERTPDATALLFAGKKWSYRQLNNEANRLAHRLIEKGVGAGSRVGVFVERSAEMVMALLGVLKTGAAYVPLDPAYPVERLNFLIEDASLASVVTESSIQDRLPEKVRNLVVSDGDGNRAAASSANPSRSVASDQPAYVIYTSGSTGTPKGVQGTHRASLNRFSWMWRTYPFKAGEICCQKTNLGFVDSIWEIFGPLLAGVPNLIIPHEAARDPEEMLQLLAREHVTRIVLVPSLLRTLLDRAPNLERRVPKLKLWTCSGEVLPVDLAKRFQEAFPEATLLNIYGSSEVAADVTYHEVAKGETTSSIAIGKPISNTQIYLVDEYGEPAALGMRGQIFVGGDNLAHGYLNRPELTAERFVSNWLAPHRSPRLYRTGDLGRFRSNGDIEYLGRVDSQVKLRGLRIELGEIESVLNAHAGVREAVVMVSGEGEQQKLAAYLVPNEDTKSAPSAGELRRYLRTTLPEHMVPASYWQVEVLPLLPSGKVNRGALAGCGGKPLVDQEELAAPRNQVEKKLAEIWQELLEVEKVGIEQNFFELGGHSLLVLQVTARIRRMFDLELPVRSVFEAPTIARLAVEVQKAEAMGLKARTPILQRHPRAASVSREALLAQLDGLSATELQNLLQRVTDGKQPA